MMRQFSNFRRRFSADPCAFCAKWDSKFFNKKKTEDKQGLRPNYREFEVLSILLANLEYFEEQFNIDGFVFEQADYSLFYDAGTLPLFLSFEGGLWSLPSSDRNQNNATAKTR